MITTNENITNMINNPVRELNARVELYNGSALVQIFKYNDALKEFTIDRVGDNSKLAFGYGICQRLNVHLIDPKRELEISTKNTLEVEFGADADYVYTYPYFKVTEVNRDENTNELSITAYDAINEATAHKVNELELSQSYTIKEFAIACGKLLGLSLNIENVTDDCFELNFENGANFDGTETIRQALDAIAEATQTIYYINSQWQLTFKRLAKDGEAVETIDKSKYFTLDSKTNRRLATICSATELGDNVSDTKTNTITSKNLLTKAVPVGHNNDVYSDFSVTDTGSSISYTGRGNVGGGRVYYNAGQIMLPYTNTANIEKYGMALDAGDYVLSFTYELLEQGTYDKCIETIVYYSSLWAIHNNLWVSPGKKVLKFTVPLSGKYGICFRLNNNYVRISDIQIEKGTTATAYEYPFEAYEVAITGTTQYVRDNPFWDMREDVGELVGNAVDNIGGLTINQFNCEARGNFLLEIGDKLNLVTKDDKTVTSYLLNDTIKYNGGLSHSMSWQYEDSNAETESNPATLGESLKQTFARVDKANKEIELLASETSENSEKISRLQMDTESINASVGVINKDIDALAQKVDIAVTSEDVSIAIQRELENGTNKVTTNTGFTFDDEGLTITKSNSEMSTQITEDGMAVSKDGNEVLKADNKGVKAIDLHAETYLIVGKNSRFEDFEGNRTGCFWIGGE